MSISVAPTVPSSTWEPSTQVYGVTINVESTTGSFSAESNPTASLLN
ncbi:MAG: hypothetical protein HKL87_09505 [Acidimicrobiaceae bacterium]|nr:hypothetical protein [Acidimicrobiaceae bacterium]